MEEVVEQAASSVAAESDPYFSSYDDLSVHELMLKDKPRTEAYKTFIEKNASLFKDKVVIDVGAGTGILSLFAAKAGARKVYAIEASGLAVLCRSIAATNGFEDVIEVIHSRVEDCILPVATVDILISEWMGFYLLHEAMLESVIYARNKWLSLDGHMFPSAATLYLCPVNMKTFKKENVDFWDNAYGFDFGPLKELVEQKHRSQPSIMTIEEPNCIAQAEEVLHLELKYVDAEDLRVIKRKLRFQITKHSLCHGFAAWFSCCFDTGGGTGGETGVVLSTAPAAQSTHWQQTVILLPDALMLSKGDFIGCSLTLEQDSVYQRHYNISIEVDEDDSEDEMAVEMEASSDGPSSQQTGGQSGDGSIADLIVEKMTAK